MYLIFAKVMLSAILICSLYIRACFSELAGKAREYAIAGLSPYRLQQIVYLLSYTYIAINCWETTLTLPWFAGRPCLR